ncbi:MAG TPA: TolC family protein [Anaeromyxobacteraceae bacterium]|nr:TolC family protein [Anaeromyxobacteraceae bacterium]
MLALVLAVMSAAAPVHLSDLLAEARQKNPELRAALGRARAAESSVSPAGALDDPMLMVQLWNAPIDLSTVPLMVQITQPLPLGGKRAARRDVARGDMAMAVAAAEAKARDVETAVAKAYFDLFLAERTIAVSSEIEGTLRSLLASAASRVAAGRGEESEVLRAKAETLKLRSESEAALARRTAANARLVALLDRPAGSEIGPTVEPGLAAAIPAEPDLRERAATERPEMAVARAAVAQVEAKLRLANAEKVPDVALFLGEMHAFRAPGQADFLFAGVQVNLPIFSGEKNHPRVAGAEADLGAMRDDARAIENRVVSEVADAHAELTAERRQVELHHQLIPVARQALASAMGAYVAGRSAFVMVLDAERDLQMHELDLATHLAMYEQRLADLQRAVGSDLGLVQAAESGTRQSH